MIKEFSVCKIHKFEVQGIFHLIKGKTKAQPGEEKWLKTES